MRYAFIFAIIVSTMGSANSADNNPCLPPPGGGLDKSLPCFFHSPFFHSPISEADYKVFFQSGSHDLTDEAKAVLDRQVAILRRFPELEIRLTGFADTHEAPDSVLMERLGKKRARAVGDYLISKGINPESILMIGGDHPPLIPKREDEKTLAAMRFVMTDTSDR